MFEIFEAQTREPEGPQDAMPPEYAAEQARLANLAAVRLARSRTLTTATILLVDFVLAVAGYLVEWSIGNQTTFGTSAGGFARHQGIETLIVGGVVCLVLLTCAVIAGRMGAFGACVLQCGLVLCLIAGTGLVAMDFFGQSSANSTFPNQQSTTQVSQTPTTGGGYGYCSGGKCYGSATKEG